MTIRSAALPRRKPSQDVQILISFHPGDPLGLMEVALADERLSETRYLQLLEAAAERLTIYVMDYRAAAQDAGTSDEGGTQ